MTNYHTHTFRCRHAEGDVADYVAAARSAGLSELGFSDHSPWPDGRWPENRMDMSELPSYMAALAAVGTGAMPVYGEMAAETVLPVSGKPEVIPADPAAGSPPAPLVFCGLECEWVPEYESLMRDEYLGHLNLDFLVLGIHTYIHRGEWRDTYRISEASELVSFAQTTCRGIESGLFSFLAHPDVYCFNWMPWDGNAIACARDILSTAERAGIPVEINGYGMRKCRVPAPDGLRYPYPREEFWNLASEYSLTCIVNSDAHRPRDTAANLEEGRALAAACGLSIVEGLPAVGTAR